MDGVSLLNRIDTKFILTYPQLLLALQQVMDDYSILEIDGLRLHRYHTLYFDTADRLFYREHHNGKRNRYKVRIRQYQDTQLCFLEIKHKNNKGWTSKKRTTRLEFEQKLSADSCQFINSHIPFQAEDLQPALTNEFSRLTLVSQLDQERITIDLALGFPPFKTSLPKNLAVVEVKRDKYSKNSAMIKALSDQRILPSSFSKYCIGTVLAHPTIKYNRFKPILRTINKLAHGPIN